MSKFRSNEHNNKFKKKNKSKNTMIKTLLTIEGVI